MTEETKDDNLEEEPEPSEIDTVYQRLSGVTPERDMLLPDDGGGGHKSLTEKLEEAPNLSDMQTADRRLFPDLDKKWLNNVEVSRVFPDIYNPLSRIFVKGLLQDSDKTLSFTEAVANVNTAMSIAIDGEGRFDELGLAGAAKEDELKKEEKKLLGGIA